MVGGGAWKTLPDLRESLVSIMVRTPEDRAGFIQPCIPGAHHKHGHCLLGDN